ncbi:MAG: 3'-5' exonuclease [Candidatus Omnitrophota bacterium]|jgi:DNA polymerase-3 subunit epsilon|nr:3'-5' exonuclease [Candidatus Omnitrophota bacterium]
MKLSKELITLDLETTGTWIEKDKIIEIAMIKSFPSGEEQVYSKRVNPGMNIPPAVIELTGIDDEAVKEAPAFGEIAGEVSAFLGDADLAGFNIEAFDLPLLGKELNSCGYKFSAQGRRIYDAKKIYHLNEKRDLSAAYRFYCGKTLEDAHSALADTRACLEVLVSQASKYIGEGSGIEELGKFDYKPKPEFYDEERRFRWWNGKLYIMFGKYARKYSLEDLAREDRKYLEWIVSADFSLSVKELAEKALRGEFPKNPAGEGQAPGNEVNGG